MKVVGDFAAVRSEAHGVVGLVPTMGFLHEGHLSLIRAAAEVSDTVVVSVFVNPLQFGDPNDLDTYPRDLDRDTALAADAGADVVFAPSERSMFGDSAPMTTVSVAGFSEAMEGIHRPGHFEGVATIVAKLLAGTQPDRAYFGRKDAQQLALVRTMARDLSFPVVIEGISTVREADGLALSSRNTRLPLDARDDARSLSEGLFAGAQLFMDGTDSVDEVTGAVAAQVSAAVDVEYVALGDAETGLLADSFTGEQFLAIAGWVEGVRLIDNVVLRSEPRSVDLGIRLGATSILYEGGS